MNKFIKNIPNILTILRIILTPFILVFAIKKQLHISIILMIVASITDFLDGKIARKFNLTSDLGAKLDASADKLYAGTLMICLILQNKLFILCLIGECLITIINVLSFLKKLNPKTIYIGKIKTTSLFITIIVSFISGIYSSVKPYVTPLICITFTLQLISIFFYLEHLIKNKIKK